MMIGRGAFISYVMITTTIHCYYHVESSAFANNIIPKVFFYNETVVLSHFCYEIFKNIKITRILKNLEELSHQIMLSPSAEVVFYDSLVFLEQKLGFTYQDSFTPV